MNTQPEALRLADWLDGHSNGPMDNKHNAAAELRRLHEVNQELLEALNGLMSVSTLMGWNIEIARAAIIKATGEQA